MVNLHQTQTAVRLISDELVRHKRDNFSEGRRSHWLLEETTTTTMPTKTTTTTMLITTKDKIVNLR